MNVLIEVPKVLFFVVVRVFEYNAIKVVSP